MDYYYKQPKYFSEFKCIGGGCAENCCRRWNIDWFSDEIEKLNRVSDSAFKEKVEKSFIYDEEKKIYHVQMIRNIKTISPETTYVEEECPFHNFDTGLCDIQKNYGEEYLGVVCKTYPRYFIVQDEQTLRWCISSCPAVLDIILNEDNSVCLETRIAHDNKKIEKRATNIEDKSFVSRFPILRYRFMLLDFFSELFTNKDRTIQNSIILGALGAKHISEVEQKGKYSEIPQLLKNLKTQLNDSKTSSSLDELKPNYKLKFKLVNNMIAKFIGNCDMITALHDGNNLVVERYIEGLYNFDKAFDNNFALKNLLINVFYDQKMPICKRDRSIFDNYSYYVLSAAVYITGAAAVGFKNVNIVDEFKSMAAQISRFLSHNENKISLIMDEMKELGLTTPAHLALIIK